MFSYASLLVEAGLVDEVYLSFLVVGHTHCNLDQEFSFMSKYISKSAWIGSPLAMQELYLTASHQAQEEKASKGEHVTRITVGVQLRYVFDWMEFFTPIVNKNIKYFQVPHRFRIKLKVERAICQYMLFTDDSLEKEVWLPAESSSVSEIDPILHATNIHLHELAVINGLPDLRRYMGLQGDIGGFFSTSNSSESEESLSLANNLQSSMSTLLELERIALASTFVNFDIQEDGGNNPTQAHTSLIAKSKAEIHREMIKGSSAKAGYLIWLDYRRADGWNGLARPRILPRVLAPGERPDDASKKLIDNARTIASVASAMLTLIEHDGISVGGNSASIQNVSNDYANKILHPIEKQWFENRKTAEQVINISKSKLCLSLIELYLFILYYNYST